MFRTLLVIAFLLAGLVSGSEAAQPLFRFVDLGVLGQFELGKPFGTYARLAVEEAPNTYRLRDKTFGGAESIVVTTDDEGLVRRISFEYGPGYDYRSKLSGYGAMLGSPTRSGTNEAIWNDGRTEFALYRDPLGGHASRAEMRDLEAPASEL